MEGQDDRRSVLATLADGSLIVSVVVEGLPLRHLYSVVSSDGTLIGTHPTLKQLADFLEENHPDDVEQLDDLAPAAR
jgi:hypothetical protein